MQYKVITAKIRTRTALHIGSGAGNETTDALIRRDAAGNPLIPGTALAGVLRDLLTRLAPRIKGIVCNALTNQDTTCHCAVCQLMGAINPSDEGENATASRLLVFNAALQKTDSGGKEMPEFQIRDGVGIDRATGAAARAGHVKFDLETLTAGAVFGLRLELRSVEDKDEQLLAAGLAEWQAGRARVGGRVNRGLGAFELENLQFETCDLDNADKLVDYLGEDRPWEKLTTPQAGWLDTRLGEIVSQLVSLPADKNIRSHIAHRWVKIEGILQASGPLLTNDTTSAGKTGFDHAPLLAQMNAWQSPVLSGASLRGVIRSHAERIARTLATYQAKDGDDFLRLCPACDPNISRVNKDSALAMESCDSLLKGLLPTNDEAKDVHLCLSCRLFGNTRRGSRLIVEDAPYEPTAQQPKPVLKMLDFLAVDRFTGGGADHFKFDALALWRPAFKLHLFIENPAPWELGWLALVLRDMQTGWLHVGMGAAKGFGSVKLENMTCTLGYLKDEDAADLVPDASGERNGSLYTEMPLTWQDAATWVTNFTDSVKDFRRGGDDCLPKIQKDTYFGVVDTLYPREVTI